MAPWWTVLTAVTQPSYVAPSNGMLEVSFWIRTMVELETTETREVHVKIVETFRFFRKEKLSLLLSGSVYTQRTSAFYRVRSERKWHTFSLAANYSRSHRTRLNFSSLNFQFQRKTNQNAATRGECNFSLMNSTQLFVVLNFSVFLTHTKKNNHRKLRRLRFVFTFTSGLPTVSA